MTLPADAATATPPEVAGVIDDPLEQGRFTRWVAGPLGQQWAESSLQLAGMHCAACSGIIERALQRLPGVHSARVSAAGSPFRDPSRP